MSMLVRQLGKNRNTIKMYRSSNVSIVTNPSLIEDDITKDFRLRFLANPNCHFDEDTDFELITPIISIQENSALIN